MRYLDLQCTTTQSAPFAETLIALSLAQAALAREPLRIRTRRLGGSHARLTPRDGEDCCGGGHSHNHAQRREPPHGREERGRLRQRCGQYAGPAGPAAAIRLAACPASGHTA